MLFNSYGFLLVFLPVFVIGFYSVTAIADQKPGCAKSAVELYCVIMSFVFFSFFGWKALAVLALSLFWNGLFLFAFRDLLVQKSSDSSDRKLSRILVFIGVCGNIALLLFFKYAGFLAQIVGSFSGQKLSVTILLPLAISFYTFSQISLLVDVYRGDIEKISLFDYLSYITFFPKLLQGPIVSYEDMSVQFEKAAAARWNSERFMKAVSLFVMGLSKKVLLADNIGAAVDWGYGNISSLTPMDAVLTAICYSFQIYFDFSGYCDMGRAICWMVGMDMPVNFNSPYKAVNIDDFWKRWHITLTRFFTRYVYIPLGGNRKGQLRTYINFLIIFTLSGFWHGAGYTFIIWGLIHGVLYVITRVFNKRRVGRFITFVFVTLAWIFFRAPALSDAISFIGRMIQTPSLKTSKGFVDCFRIDEIWYVLKVTPIARMSWGSDVCMWMFVAISSILVFAAPNAYDIAEKRKPSIGKSLILALLLVWSILTFARVSTYIYLGF